MDLARLSRDGAGVDSGPYNRLEALHRFVSDGTISREEIRYLKIVLSRFTTDLICELPVELVKQIGLYLEPEHFIKCLSVSKGWRRAFLSSPVISAAARRYWPYLVQMSWKGLVTEDVFLHTLHRRVWGHAKRSQSRLTGLFEPKDPLRVKFSLVEPGRMLVPLTMDEKLSMADEIPPLSYIGQSLKYSRGRLAWTPEERTIVVYNLWTKTHKIFTLPSGPIAGLSVQIEAVGSRLVVGSVDRLLVAWDHTTSQHREKKLPGRVKHCTVIDYNVAIVLFSGDVFVWEFGGKLGAIPMTTLIPQLDLDTESASSWRSNLHAIVDPYCSSALWLASCCFCFTDTKPVLRRTVHEFRNGDLVAPYVFDLPAPNSSPGDSLTNQRFHIQYLADESNVIAFRNKSYRGHEHEPASVAFFDMYSKEFTHKILRGKDLSEFLGQSDPSIPFDLDFRVHMRVYMKDFITVYSFQPGVTF